MVKNINIKRRLQVRRAGIARHTGLKQPVVRIAVYSVFKVLILHHHQDIVVTMLGEGEDFAYITDPMDSDQTILLCRNEQRGVMMALSVRRGRPKSGSPLMTTPLAELEATAEWNRALCAWGAWLTWVTMER